MKGGEKAIQTDADCSLGFFVPSLVKQTDFREIPTLFK
jgi:hypothetical protein